MRSLIFMSYLCNKLQSNHCEIVFSIQSFSFLRKPKKNLCIILRISYTKERKTRRTKRPQDTVIILKSVAVILKYILHRISTTDACVIHSDYDVLRST